MLNMNKWSQDFPIIYHMIGVAKVRKVPLLGFKAQSIISSSVIDWVIAGLAHCCKLPIELNFVQLKIQEYHYVYFLHNLKAHSFLLLHLWYESHWNLEFGCFLYQWTVMMAKGCAKHSPEYLKTQHPKLQLSEVHNILCCIISYN